MFKRLLKKLCSFIYICHDYAMSYILMFYNFLVGVGIPPLLVLLFLCSLVSIYFLFFCFVFFFCLFVINVLLGKGRIEWSFKWKKKTQRLQWNKYVYSDLFCRWPRFMCIVSTDFPELFLLIFNKLFELVICFDPPFFFSFKLQSCYFFFSFTFRSIV